MSNHRLEYIDLAKGVGIVFIVALHIGALPTWLPQLSASWVPLFFILSGMFFKNDESFSTMIIKKINSILVPFVFFYIFSYALFYIFEYFTPGLIKTEATGLGDILRQEGYFNGPIWFLLSLFWDFIILWTIFRIFTNKMVRLMIVLAFGLLGVLLGVYKCFLPFKVAQAFTALPFFYLGYILHTKKLLNLFNRTTSFFLSIGLFILSALLALLFGPAHLEPSLNLFIGNIFISYIIIISFTFATIFISKSINRIGVINYFGKYSLIPLCLHHLVYRPILLICSSLPAEINIRVLVSIITIIIIYIIMPLFIKYLPTLCGQKNLIKLR